MVNIGNDAELWMKKAGVRAIKTMAQTAIATIGSSALITQVDWLTVIFASLLAGVLSILTSLAGLPEVELIEERKKLDDKLIDAYKMP